MAEIIIPYKPRFPQDKIHKILEMHRFVVLVAHRRMGKTVMVVNHLIKKALLCERENGVFAYVAPFKNQAKNIAWQYLKKFTSPLPGCVVNESELFVQLPNKARIRLFGADNADALRGLYFDGVVLDEVAQMQPYVWWEVIRPALSDREGFAVFIGTPRGINLFYELYALACRNMNQGQNDWHATLCRADETGVLPDKELNALKADMSPNAFRQEYLCDFSAASDDLLIPIYLAAEAAGRVRTERDIYGMPVILGVDVARFGDDSSVIFRRQGLLALPPLEFRGVDNMELAARVAVQIAEHRPQAVFVDAGRGEGVIDRLRQLGHSVVEINFGGQAARPERYANKRTEMWAELAAWLKAGGTIPNCLELKADLSTPTYAFDAAGRMVLESKDKMRERLGRSPDLADALALTFAMPVAPPAPPGFYKENSRAISQFDPFG